MHTTSQTGSTVLLQEVAGIRDLVAQWLKMVEFFEKASKSKRLNRMLVTAAELNSKWFETVEKG